MPIYGKSKPLLKVLAALLNNLSTSKQGVRVNKFVVNFLVKHGFFRHLGGLYRI
jgi:hypothetical protein